MLELRLESWEEVQDSRVSRPKEIHIHSLAALADCGTAFCFRNVSCFGPLYEGCNFRADALYKSNGNN